MVLGLFGLYDGGDGRVVYGGFVIEVGFGRGY